MAATDSVPSTERSMLPIRMMKVSPIASVSGTAAELASAHQIAQLDEIGIGDSDQHAQHDQHRQRRQAAPAPAAEQGGDAAGEEVISVVRSMSETDFRGSVWIVKKPLPVC